MTVKKPDPNRLMIVMGWDVAAVAAAGPLSEEQRRFNTTKALSCSPISSSSSTVPSWLLIRVHNLQRSDRDRM